MRRMQRRWLAGHGSCWINGADATDGGSAILPAEQSKGIRPRLPWAGSDSVVLRLLLPTSVGLRTEAYFSFPVAGTFLSYPFLVAAALTKPECSEVVVPTVVLAATTLSSLAAWLLSFDADG